MKKHTRKISLLSGIQTTIEPAKWLQQAGAKDFDTTSTRILRVFRHAKDGEQFLVYGMRATNGKKDAEAYDFAPADALGAVLDRVAKHCGLDDLRAKVTA